MRDSESRVAEDVFIAYAGVDAVVAEQVHAALIGAGLAVFRDQTDIVAANLG
jgi:hypothetical protein